jgi:hypothetical protein
MPSVTKQFFVDRVFLSEKTKERQFSYIANSTSVDYSIETLYESDSLSIKDHSRSHSGSRPFADHTFTFMRQNEEDKKEQERSEDSCRATAS